jgi:hypothetical protein
MKKHLYILTILISSTLYAQKTNGTIYFKDGTNKKGYIKITQNDKIKFKKNKNSEDIIKYSSIEIEKVEIEHEKYGKKILFYKKVESPFQNSNKLLPKLIDGKVNLYLDIVFNGQNGVSHDYYADKEKGTLTKIWPVGLFANGSEKVISEYFKDCPELLKLLKREAFRKFVKMKKGNKTQFRLEEIVKYYNNKCE